MTTTENTAIETAAAAFDTAAAKWLKAELRHAKTVKSCLEAMKPAIALWAEAAGIATSATEAPHSDKVAALRATAFARIINSGGEPVLELFRKLTKGSTAEFEGPLDGDKVAGIIRAKGAIAKHKNALGPAVVNVWKKLGETLNAMELRERALRSNATDAATESEAAPAAEEKAAEAPAATDWQAAIVASKVPGEDVVAFLIENGLVDAELLMAAVDMASQTKVPA